MLFNRRKPKQFCYKSKHYRDIGDQESYLHRSDVWNKQRVLGRSRSNYGFSKVFIIILAILLLLFLYFTGDIMNFLYSYE